MHEQPLRACRREFVGQAGAAHTELPQGRKAGAQAGYWRPPRQRRDQVAPHAQPGALPTAELLQGWCEARVAHRWHTVLGTTLSSRPHRPGLCRHLLPQPRAATAPLAPGPGRALPGEAGHGLPVPEHTPGQRPWQAQPPDWAVRGAGLHHSRAMALPGLPWGDGPRLAQQGTHRVLPHAWRACFWGRRVRSPPCPRVSPHTPQALGDAQHGTGHCPRGIAAPSSASPETTGWRPSAAAPSLPVPLPEPGGNLLKHAHPRCSSLVRLPLERSDDSGVLRAPSATQSSTWTPFLALNSVFIDSSAHCLGWENRGFVITVLPGWWVESAQDKALCEQTRQELKEKMTDLAHLMEAYL